MQPEYGQAPEGRCYACFRPRRACFCASIPTIDNQTEVLILQHWRERFHPFNTARIVRRALRNSSLLADHTSNLAMRLQLKPRAGLLYPGPTARLISDLAPGQRPDQLVVLDGTWHHAKTLIRDIPALRALPRYRLAPPAPSRYRIRREPNDISLSTIEAAVAALRLLEPRTEGFDQLLGAFDAMVEGQLAHPGSTNGRRFRQRRQWTFKNTPLALLGDLEHIVVAYGESVAGQRGRKRAAGPPIAWVARRLGDGQTFSCLLTPPRPLDDTFLGHLRLSRADLATALSPDEARRRWAMFQRTSDVVTVFHPGTARLFSHLAGDRQSCLVLKSVELDVSTGPPTRNGDWPLDGGWAWDGGSTLSGASGDPAGNPADPVGNLGRAGRRLAGTIAYVLHLNALANAQSHKLYDQAV